MDSSYRTLLQGAYERYLDCLDEQPDEAPLPYDFAFLKNRKWYLLGEELISSDLNELTNLLNRWQFALVSWDSWNKVLAAYDEDNAWQIRYEFLDTLAHECLLRPSALRDTLTSVGTKAFHQAKLSIDSTYRDHLPDDPISPSDRPKHPKRQQKESHLHTLAKTWAGGDRLLAAIRTLDNQSYKDATADYRNRVNHTIGPRLGVGETCLVTRSVQQAKRLEKQPDGRFLLQPVPNKMSVDYGFGGTPPLDLVAAYQANLAQYRLARDCYALYSALLRRIVETIAPLPPAEATGEASAD
ncbi:MAG: hypothetical protein CVU34_18915 [Betaproteobacteria bacterium HGW-Betaproteobacteria-7]|jgi:hypothetical protein|nr:MAG: hypothetical protein CVU34_18915 [Betaproteobacteria bacterium HGW-Betaproteobacteria-7]